MTLSSSFILAQAAGDAGAPGGGLFGNPMIMIVLMFVMIYFITIRPQQKRQQEQEALQKGAKAGDQVIMAGGMHGTITSVREKTVMVRIADNVKCEFDKSAIATVVKPSSEPSDAKS